MKKNQKLIILLVVLMIVLALSVVACNKGNDPIEEGWYLSLSSSGYPVYDNISSVPDAVAMKEEGGVWSISVTLAQNEQFFIKSASGKSVGFDSVFSTATQLVAGDDGAIKVAAAGAYVLSYDGESITYSYTPPAAVRLTGIALSQTTLALEKGTAQQLVLSFLPEGATPVGVIWTSDDNDVASVTQEGVVTALNYGTATVTATTTTGGFTANCTVTVIKHATGLYLSASQLSVVAGGSAKDVSVNVIPADSTELEYTASLTSGAEFAELSDDGEGNISVYGKAEGTAILFVSLASDPDSVAECAITILPEGSVLADLPASLDMKIGEETTITASIENFDGNIDTVNWTVSGTAISVQGNEMTATVTANDFGVATINLVIFDDQSNTYGASCTVYVGEDFFFVYGYGVGAKDWDYLDYISDKNAAEEANVLLKEESRGVWTLTRFLNPDDGLQIIFPSVGSFTEDVDGEKKWNKNIPSDLVSVSTYYDASRSSRQYLDNEPTYFSVTESGVYKLTLDLTGASAKVYINVVSLTVGSVSLELESGDYIFEAAGESATISYSVSPSAAAYGEDEVSMEWTSAFSGYKDYISAVRNNEAKTITVSLLSVPPQDFSATLNVTIAGKSASLTFYALKTDPTPVKSIAFENSAYDFNLNNGMGLHSITVKAKVNDDATNQQVRYFDATDYRNTALFRSVRHLENVDAITGEITSQRCGTFRIGAYALDNPDVIDYTDVLFYSDVWYLIGPNFGGWTAPSQSTTSLEGNARSAYQFTQISKSHYRLEYTFKQNDTFQVVFLGMNDSWAGKLSSTKGEFSNHDSRWAGSSVVGICGFQGSMKIEEGTMIFDIDLRGPEPMLVGTDPDISTYKGYLPVYDGMPESFGSLTNVPTNVGFDKTKDIELFTVPEAKIPANELTYELLDDGDSWATLTYDENINMLHLVHKNANLREDKVVTVHVSYKELEYSFSFNLLAEHHMQQTWDDNEHWLYCTDEGCEFTEGRAQHDRQGVYSMDADGHYYACSGCGKEYERQKHTCPLHSRRFDFGNDQKNCTVCGYELFEIQDGTLLSYAGYAKEVWIPDSVTAIGDSVFAGHSEISVIRLGSATATIGSYAFDGCTGLTEISMPKVSSIGKYAFRNCSATVDFGALSPLVKIGEYAFYGYKGTSITIPSSVRMIDFWAFAYSALESIVIPDSVTDVSGHAFEYCTNLRSAVIGKGMDFIGANMFAYCTALEKILVLHPKFWNLGLGGLLNCTNIKALYVSRWYTDFAGITPLVRSFFTRSTAMQHYSLFTGRVWLYSDRPVYEKPVFNEEGYEECFAGVFHFDGTEQNFDTIVTQRW